ncbi:MAG: exodeoxyribonuclease VII small subunit [Anaerolineaceae bacterium]|jgi:exodeoxyribonuclease VII small subunit|nr:exodeoxyribonuclease VII small subunit [Anaerolineae bacterium]MDO9121604.1 exodeoxyribonuclease VII small subunit [Anaerolineaceae bacterium]MDP3449067.1 exodeoxyribonuclease VII small subunit [Anaerolineaceae bacterium]MDP3721229.1 exodeoxyribonuclease VII small subunit [Anaerolineaceae bacterium]PKN99222.1 MAG: exodeoxyribonuclease VII small subunit [Chloroflexi bacterium HGW-Chloroflexi-5]
MAKTDKTPLALTYEQAFSELESIVEAMENQQQPLDETMKLFERGQILSQHCTSLLDNAELRIKELNTSKSSLDKED